MHFSSLEQAVHTVYHTRMLLMHAHTLLCPRPSVLMHTCVEARPTLGRKSEMRADSKAEEIETSLAVLGGQ